MPDKIATIEHTFPFRSMHLLVCHTACHLLCFNMMYYLPDSCSIYIQDVVWPKQFQKWDPSVGGREGK